MIIVLGSENPAKLRAAQMVVDRLFPGEQVVGVKVPSGVADQPTSDEEAMAGAMNRARAAQQLRDADYGIGMEGGFQRIGDRHLECGWIAVAHRDGRVGIGSSGRFELSGKIVALINSGLELSDAVAKITSSTERIGNQEGVMGAITCGHVPRDVAYSHGLFFAFGPFISDQIFWD